MDRVEARKATSPLVVALVWVVVSIPLAWGVATSVKKSLPLFQAVKTAR